MQERVISMLDQLLMKWIVREGKDMFNLQANSFDIAKGIQEDLDMEMMKIGISIAIFNISSFTYPEEIQKMVTKTASQSVVGDMGRYQQMSMIDAMANGNGGGRAASDMAGMAMGMMMGQQMAGQMSQTMFGTDSRHRQLGGTDPASEQSHPRRRLEILSGVWNQDRRHEILPELRQKTDVG